MENPGLRSFLPHVHDAFVAIREGGEVQFVLVEASALDGSATTDKSFSLIFHSQSPTLFPQDIFRLEHPVAGECEIFLVPVGRHKSGFVYQAIFN
ncbi:DUF6916 family protein [Rhodanobacter sp. Col0626]|uniref:DUF6916 family protein n=1 Tax=Rhodanobacter sp. Col0626 TaxID=3415679 RepID=UPI003CE6BCBC